MERFSTELRERAVQKEVHRILTERDHHVKTRDIWFYSTVLFSVSKRHEPRIAFSALSDLFAPHLTSNVLTLNEPNTHAVPSLCRFPMVIMSCQSLHPGAITESQLQRQEPAPWATEMFLRWDMEEKCYVGEHMSNVMLVALPSILLYALGLPLCAFDPLAKS